MKKYTLITSSVLIVATVASILFAVLLPQKVNALSGSEFQAGRIIDDGAFFNGGDMDIPTIQAFLNAKMPNCDTYGTQPYAGTTRAVYGASRGNPAPYTCLKDYYVDVWGKAADQYCSAINYGRKSAAGIIYDVARACNINPKVLLVLLQKEQSLVTDDWPWPVQYTKATGMGCPDSSLGTDVDSNQNGCYDEYEGLFNQIYYGARQYQRYAKQPQYFNFKAYQNQTINYNPNPGCGGSTIYIQNQATAGLYNYTPYQPNQAALNNLYGTGDSCSAYGNRNFWRMYSDWFGSTYGPSFRAEYHSQSPYPIIDTGQAISVFFQFRNVGTAFWKDDKSTFPGYHPVRIANANPINRSSMFRASNWTDASRPTGFFSAVYESDGVTKSPDQSTVYPGQIARFEFTINVDPSIPGGVYREYFQPILEGATSWNLGTWAYIDIGVNHPNYRSSFHSQAEYPTLNRGSSTYTFIRYKNTGSEPWYDDQTVFPGKTPIHLASTWPINRGSWFNATWPQPSRPDVKFYKVLQPDGVTLAPNQHVTMPGQIAEFAFTITAPSNMPPGIYKEYFEVIAEGAPWSKWSIGQAAWLQITVN